MQQRALEEGPLPFLFNFKAADAKKRYEMALVAEDATTSHDPDHPAVADRPG